MPARYDPRPLIDRANRDTASEPPPVLIVDDAPWYQEMLEGFIARLGYRPTVCRDRTAALAEFGRHARDHFTAIVTDISMWEEHHRRGMAGLWLGELSGVQLCRDLRRLGFRGRLIVASTGTDNALGRFLTALWLPLWGVHWVIPKRRMRRLGGPDAPLDAVLFPNRLLW